MSVKTIVHRKKIKMKRIYFSLLVFLAHYQNAKRIKFKRILIQKVLYLLSAILNCAVTSLARFLHPINNFKNNFFKKCAMNS